MSAEVKQAVSDQMKNYWAERSKAETTGSDGAENAADGADWGVGHCRSELSVALPVSRPAYSLLT